MIRPAAIALAVLAVSIPAFAQTSKAADSASFADLTKDMQELPGLMTFYKYKDGDANPAHDQTKLLCVVPRSLLKQDLLFAVNFSRGNLSGFQYLDGLVRWEQVGRQLTLVAPNTGIVDKQGSQFPINEAVRRTYRPSFIFSLPVVAMSPSGDPVVDLGQALFSPSPVVPLPVQGSVRRDISRINEAKSFDQNVLVDVDYALSAGNGGPTVGVSFGFRKLPNPSDGYRPRKADDRVGYFQTTRQDWTTKYDQREIVDRYVNRWDLKKKDPTLDVSPPEKPITFILDKSIPYQWRKYVADGALEWNKAFEKCGIVGAVVVQQQTDDNEFADIDPADARYNFIQWTVRNQALAVGPSRADPRTGQILDADIVVDDAWIRYFNDRGEVFGPKTTASVLGPDTLAFLTKHPEYLPPGVTADDVKAARATFAGDLMKSEGEDAAKEVPPALVPKNRQQCNLAIGLVSQIAMAQGLYAEAAKGTGLPKVPDQIIGNALKEIVTHEVGHTLGLRHNFKASSWLTLDEVRKHRDAGEPFVSSVMDYTPLAIFADDDLTKVRSFASDTIGPYDYWAIGYGYGDPKDGQSVQQFLKGVTDQSGKKEYAYATDEDTEGLISPDPLTNRYDLSDNPLAWAKSSITLTDKLLAHVGDWAAKPDEPNYYLRQTFLQLAAERSRNLNYVARLVGGQYFSRAHRSDPGAPAPLTPVDSKLQRDALALIGKTVLSQDFYKFSRDLLNRLTPSRWYDNDDDGPSARIDFPYSRYVQAQYENTLLALCSPQTLQRVYDAEANDDNANKMTAAELIRSVRDSVWSELDAGPATQPTDARPMISPERRGMQDTQLQFLLATANADPSLQLSPDVQNLARYGLRELADKIGKVLDSDAKLDFGTRGHLTEARSKILRTLDKPLVDRGSGTTINIRVGNKPADAKPE